VPVLDFTLPIARRCAHVHFKTLTRR
jgi:hypothetical protein